MTGLGNSMDLPFEHNPPGQRLDLSHAHLSGGVVVMAATVPVPDVGIRPCLIFRFATPLGDMYPPMLLVLDDDQASKLPALVSTAVDAAMKEARDGRDQ